MRFGAVITYGASDYQIFQQKDGFADITIGGFWHYDGKPAKPNFWPELAAATANVSARVVEEATGRTVVGWTSSPHGESKEWEITLRVPASDALYKIETRLEAKLTNGDFTHLRGDIIFHVGVGEVFIIAGQSNAAGAGRNPVYDEPQLGCHVFRNNGKWDVAVHPLCDSTESKHNDNTEIWNGFVSPWLAFAKELRRLIHRPIGLVQTSLGGSALANWNPKDGFLYENMKNIVADSGTTPSWALWYQGCSDTNNSAYTYLDRFNDMVDSWRRDICPDMKFLTVQLNRLLTGTEQDFPYYAMIREAQRKACHTRDGVYVIPSTDAKTSDVIHNDASGCITIGERAARLIYGVMSGNTTGVLPIEATKAHLNENTVTVEFTNLVGCLYTSDPVLERAPFTVMDGQDNIVKLTAYRLCGNKVELDCESIPSGELTVSAMWQTNPATYPIVDDTTIMPILSFYKMNVER